VSGGAYVYASAGGSEVKRALAAKDVVAFREAWARVYEPAGEVLARLASCDELIVNRVLRVSCKRWVDGAQVLVGDAAHAMAPNLGQGANSALVDVAVLADLFVREPDVAAGLAAYQRRRRRAVEKVARTAEGLGRLAEYTNPLLRWVRDQMVMPLAAQFAGVGAQQARILQEPAATLRAIGAAISATTGSRSERPAGGQDAAGPAGSRS
jgi:2-polyprenyl-6-methoxyphenol hydroxylase-like FAD-dependent oxidoreductase